MKTYITIDNVNRKFDTMRDAVQYAEDNFDDELESFEMNVYSENGEYLEDQIVVRNPHNESFVYAAWGFGVSKWNDNEYDWNGDEFNTLEQLLENETYLAAKEKGYGLRVEKYTQTVDESIGDTVDTYHPYEEDGE